MDNVNTVRNSIEIVYGMDFQVYDHGRIDLDSPSLSSVHHTLIKIPAVGNLSMSRPIYDQTTDRRRTFAPARFDSYYFSLSCSVLPP